MKNEHLQSAIASIRSGQVGYEKNERYYNGDHDLRFATEKFENTFGTLFREFALNLCPVICDAVRDKLRITGFSPDAAAGTDVESIRAAASAIWTRNRMGMRSGEAHKEALKNGDAYAIVWPDERGRAAIYINRASQVSVTYDEAAPGVIIRAAKVWPAADKRWRINLFYADRTERYVSRSTGDTSVPDASLFELDTMGAEVENPFGVVPVFHFANNADLGFGGRSELKAAIPVQDGLNKSVLDMLVAMEFAAYRQRWAVGIEVEYDIDGQPIQPFQGGIDHLWTSGNPQARFGDFDPAELEQFLKVKDSFRLDMASVTGTPLHYFLQSSGDHPSGESLKKAETRFLAKVRDRQESFGQVWADIMRFALQIETGKAGITLATQWEDPAPMAEREFLENILLKKQIGLTTHNALIEAGYGEAEAAAMLMERRHV